MFALKITRWLLGYVRFSILGGSPERFLNGCARSGAYLWEIRGSADSGACVLCGNYRLLRCCARRAGCRLRVRDRRGLPFLLRRTRGHRGLLAGAVLFFVILSVLSSRVWCVEITGNGSVQADAVRSALAEAGLYPGALRKNVNSKQLEQKIMLSFPEIGWMSVNTRASVVEVNLKEKVEAPRLVEKDGFCNLTASQTGQILSMKVYAGTPMVKKGDAVVKGQLLVSAVVEDDLGGSTLVHSEAEILAETSRTLTEEIPLQQEEEEFTGETVTRRRLDFFGLRLPLTLVGKPSGSCRVAGVQTDVRLFGTLLPIGMYEETWKRFRAVPVELTREQARCQAEQKIREQKEALEPDCKILSEKISDAVSGGRLLYRAELSCEENIVKESGIFIKN